MHKNIFMIFKRVIFIFLVSSLRINQKALILLHKKKYAMWYIQIGLLAVIYHRVQFKGRTETIQHHSLQPLLLDSFHVPKHTGCHSYTFSWARDLLYYYSYKEKKNKHQTPRKLWEAQTLCLLTTRFNQSQNNLFATLPKISLSFKQTRDNWNKFEDYPVCLDF